MHGKSDKRIPTNAYAGWAVLSSGEDQQVNLLQQKSNYSSYVRIYVLVYT